MRCQPTFVASWGLRCGHESRVGIHARGSRRHALWHPEWLASANDLDRVGKMRSMGDAMINNEREEPDDNEGICDYCGTEAPLRYCGNGISSCADCLDRDPDDWRDRDERDWDAEREEREQEPRDLSIYDKD